MSEELRNQIVKLLSDIPGDLEPEDEKHIIDVAYKKLSSSKKKINEETIIDAVLAAFQDDNDDIYFDDEYEEELFDLLRVSSYDEQIIKKALNSFSKKAASEADMHRGSIGSYYDPKGKDYRPADEKATKKPKMKEFEIKDEGHKDIEYHNDATKTKTVHRTRADMLNRGL